MRAGTFGPVRRSVLQGFAAVVALFAIAGPATAQEDEIARGLLVAERDLLRDSRTLPRDAFPGRTAGRGGRWLTTSAASWTSGFRAGSMWAIAELSGDPRWRVRAARAQRGLAGQAANTSTHDVGFILHTPYARAFRLTRRPAYRWVLLRGAASLATRFDPKVGATRSWGQAGDPTFRVIVDNLMNLELLLWGARHGGPRAWREMAVRHGLTALRDHVRPDGSTFHVVEYDPGTGAVVARRTRQGFADGSTWSRGQAWAIHGFTTLYRETRDPRFLVAARRTADHWLSRLPRGGVPPWDFDAPMPAPSGLSAGAIAASGLAQLARLDPQRSRGERYATAAVRTVNALSRPLFMDTRQRSASTLLHGTSDGARGRLRPRPGLRRLLLPRGDSAGGALLALTQARLRPTSSA